LQVALCSHKLNSITNKGRRSSFLVEFPPKWCEELKSFIALHKSAEEILLVVSINELDGVIDDVSRLSLADILDVSEMHHNVRTQL